MNVPKKQSFKRFSKQAERLLDEYLESQGFQRSAGARGEILGSGLCIRFDIDEALEELRLEYDALPPGITTARASNFVRRVIAEGKPVGPEGDPAGVYNYFRIYIHNLTRLRLTPKSKTPERGSIEVLQESVAPHNTEVQDPRYGVLAYAQAYECQAENSSAYGAKGSITMDIGNGAAHLTMDYQVRGGDWFGWDVKIGGREAGRFGAQSIDYWYHLHSQELDPPPGPGSHLDSYTYATVLLTVTEL